MPIDSFFSSVVDGVGSIINTSINNNANRRLAEYQNAFNLEMWNRQNEYNSPSATIQRLVDAGINPRAYGQLGQFANSADAPQAASIDYKSPLGAFSDIMRTTLEMKNLQSITEKNEAEKLKATTQAATEQAKALDLLSQTEHRARFSNREEDKLKIQIIDALRRAWHEGDHDLNTGLFNTQVPPLTFDHETFGISGLKRINDNENVFLRNLNENEIQQLRKQQKDLNQNELDFLNNVPKEAQWIVKILLMLSK